MSGKKLTIAEAKILISKTPEISIYLADSVAPKTWVYNRLNNIYNKIE